MKKILNLRFFIYFLLLFLIAVPKVSQAFEPTKKMRKVFENEYDKLWKKVDSLNNKQLPKSALMLVNQIYDKAKTEDNQSQIRKNYLLTYI